MLTYPQPGDKFGQYDIERRIGRGGMGVVYAAKHRDLDRDVALKLLSPELAESEDYRNRFVREARIQARLDSPHIVRVFDAGERDGWLYIATELVPDGDLAEMLAATGPLERTVAFDVVAQVAEGLAVAHGQGILHRDIKPSNVLIRREADGSLRALVCDLGISAVLGSEHTKTAGVVGTLGYMAPERHHGEPATVASDIYSVGCLLWAVLQGAPPYRGTDLQVALGHLNEPVPRLPGDDPRDRRVDAILERAMAKAPDERYASADELRTALLEQPTPPQAGELDAPTIARPIIEDEVTEVRPLAPTLDLDPGPRRSDSEATLVVARPVVDPGEGVAPGLRRPSRMRGVLVAVAVVAVAAVVGGAAIVVGLNGSGDGGSSDVAAAHVGEESVDMSEVDQVSADYCAAIASQLGASQAVPMKILRDTVVGALAIRAAIPQFADDRSAALDTDVQVAPETVSSQFAGDDAFAALPSVQQEAVVAVQGAVPYLEAVEVRVGNATRTASRDFARSATQVGRQAFAKWVDKHGMTFDDQFDVHFAYNAVSPNYDVDTAIQAASDLPADERCGGPQA